MTLLSMIALVHSHQLKLATSESQLVVEGADLSKAEIERRAKMSPAQLDQELLSKGYAKVEQKNASIYFSELIWQGKRMESTLALYRHLADAIRPDGTLDFAKDPELAEFVKGKLAASGWQLPDGASPVITLSRTLSVSFGDRVVKAPCNGGGSSFQNLQNQWLTKLDSNIPYGETKPGFDFYFGYRFFAYGDISGSRTKMAWHYQLALDRLAEHWSDFNTKRAPYYQAALDKLSGYSVKKMYGDGYGSLPADLQLAIKSAFTGDYLSLGFTGLQEAINAAQQSILQSSSGSLTMTAGAIGDHALFGLGLP